MSVPSFSVTVTVPWELVHTWWGDDRFVPRDHPLSNVKAFDAIVLDLIMPGMPGVEVLRTLRDRNYSGGVIIMTGSHNEELLREAWCLGLQEILIKPVDLERLLTAIQLVLVCREC